jgi:hypothetical protein
MGKGVASEYRSVRACQLDLGRFTFFHVTGTLLNGLHLARYPTVGFLSLCWQFSEVIFTHYSYFIIANLVSRCFSRAPLVLANLWGVIHTLSISHFTSSPLYS